MRTKSFTRDERKVQIVTWFVVRIQNGNERYATVNEVARGLNMSPSNHLLKILKEMYVQKRLMQKESFKPGRWRGWAFMLYPGTYAPPKPRQIALKIGGKPAGQLELFS